MNYSNPELVGNMTAAQQQAQTANLLATVEVGEAAYEAGYWKRRALIAEQAAKEANRDFHEVADNRDRITIMALAWKNLVKMLHTQFAPHISRDEILALFQQEQERITEQWEKEGRI